MNTTINNINNTFKYVYCCVHQLHLTEFLNSQGNFEQTCIAACLLYKLTGSTFGLMKFTAW